MLELVDYILKVIVISTIYRRGSRTAAISKMERFVIIVNGCKPLTIITQHSIVDVAAALDALLISVGSL